MTNTLHRRSLRGWLALGVTTALVVSAVSLTARQAKPAAPKGAQVNDAEYTKRILDNTPDKRILTELVDHLPASATVPTPLKALGYIPGENGNITYSADIYKYLDAVDAASARVTCWSIGKTEEGRDTRACAIADELTIKSLDKYKQITAQLTDPRKLTDAQAKNLIATGKPIYWATGSIHSGETGSPEMLMELAYRLAVEESPAIQLIRNNVITVLTPTTEVDGHDRQVDNQRAQRATPAQVAPSMVYWGKYVAHDNNRDGIGKGLNLSQNVLHAFLDMHPTVLHDLHESVNLLYTSTGTGPYNAIVDPIQVSEWWMLAQNDVLELTKRGVPGVWTYNYYDGWVPNYMFWIGVSHNSIGRFYETQSGGNTGANGASVNTPPANSKEWYRPNPNPGDVKWNLRANVNMQQSGVLISLTHVAKNHDTYLENYYTKMKHSIERGKTLAPFAYVIPAGQRGKGGVANLVNLIRNEGADVSIASAAFKAGTVDVAAGDYVVRMDQPYSGIVEMYLGVQWYPADNPRPYDDTGWAIPLLHNVTVKRVDDKAVLDGAMTTLTADVKAPGSVTGTGATIIVDNTTDTSLMTFRVKNAAVKMMAAEQAFDMGGHHFAAGAFVIPNANRATIEASVREHGLQAWATDAAPNVPMHELDLPRVGYIHSWQNTQEEGWTRMGLDKMGVPFTYFGDNEVRKGNLRARFDVILYPGATVQIAGGEMPVGGDPQPYKKTALTPNVGTPDQTDDRRGGLGRDGFLELQKFVMDGGVLITEGQTTEALVNYNIAPGVDIADTPGTYVPGSVMKTMLGDKTSPILYGYDQAALAVLIKGGPAMQVGPSFGGGGGGRGGALPPGVGGGNLQPMANAPQLTTLDGSPAPVPMGTMPARGGGAGGAGGRGGAGFGGGGGEAPPAAAAGAGRAGGGGGRAGGGGGGRGGGAAAAPAASAVNLAPKVLLSYPNDAKDLLLSGELVGGENLTGKAVLVDAPLGKGHVVMFANRPFWRNEPHGNYMLWFNAMLNWNDLSK